MAFTAEDAVTFIRYAESGILGFMSYLFLTDTTVGQNAIARYAACWLCWLVCCTLAFFPV